MPIGTGPKYPQPHVPHAATERLEQARSGHLGGQYTWYPVPIAAPTSTSTFGADIAPGGEARWLSALVDNYTNQWLWIKSAGIWVPPYVVGRCVPLRSAPQFAADWLAPSGITQPSPIAGASSWGGIALLTDHELAPCPGLQW